MGKLNQSRIVVHDWSDRALGTRKLVAGREP